MFPASLHACLRASFCALIFPCCGLVHSSLFLRWINAAFLQAVDVVAYLFHLHHAFVVVVSIVCSGSTMSLFCPPPVGGVGHCGSSLGISPSGYSYP